MFLFATSASAQFANNPALKGKPPEADAAKPADMPADPPADPANPAPAPAAAAPAGTANAMFAAIDADGDGIISKVELKKAIVALKKLDADNDGNITLAECGADAAGPAAAVAGNNQATQWIDQVMIRDRNKDGKLTPNELNDNEKQMLQNADLNNDRAIDRQELLGFANNGAALNTAVGAFNGAGGNVGPGGRGGNNEAMGLFLKYDRNHDGRLTTDEVPPQALQSLSAADLDRDGVINAAEFQAMSSCMGDRMKAALGAGNGGNPIAPGAPNGNPVAPGKRGQRNQN